MPELSVVVPVYNVEKYLERCINSIIDQTFTDYEVFLIDDGSQDRSGEICDAFSKVDRRIKVIHQKNRGVSAARNVGIQQAIGNYIVFLDSDDFIEKEMFQIMLSIAKKQKVDVVICGINYCNEKGELLRSGLKNVKGYDQKGLLNTLFEKPNPIGGGCANKLFKLEIDNKVYFDEKLSLLEDTFYLFDKFCACNNAIQIDKTLYNVVERKGSATRSNEIEVMYKIILNSKQLIYKARDYSKELEGKAIDKFLDNCLRYGIMIKNYKKNEPIYVRKKINSIRMKMITMIMKSKRNNLLSNAQIRGYLLGILRL